MASTKPKSNWKLSEFVAHGTNVNCLSLSPSNGHMLATGGDDRKVNLWLVGKPNNIMSISGMTSSVQCVAFNNSENWLGAGSKSGVVKVFDLEANRTVRSISGHKAAICSMDFHRYGDILASGSMDTNLKLWDVRRKGCIFTYKGHTEVVKDIQFSPDGKWVASASSDCTIKIWDLSAGKMLVDLKTHSKGVTTVQFHPRELLMASGSMDRTVKFYDLERFACICETPPESNGVRKILFHPDGTALFTGTEESLKVHGWEPYRTFDVLPLHWGKVDDMTLSGEQLIAASYAQTNVSVWCIDVKHLRPFSGDTTTMPSEPASSDACPTTTSGRGLFEYKHQEISPPSSSEGPRGVAANGSENSALPESVNDEDGSPPTQIKDTARKELFAARQKLIRTPPKKLQPLFRPPSCDADSVPSKHLALEPSKLNQVQYIPNFVLPEFGGQKILPPKSSAEEKHQNGSALPGRRKLHQLRDPIRPSQSEAAAVGSKVAEEMARQAVGGFVPPDAVSADPYGVPHRISSRGAEEIITNHLDISQILKSRLSALREVRGAWSVSDPRVSLDLAVDSNNASVLVDVLNVLHLKKTLWSLDMALIVLPELKLLLRSKYTVYVGSCCNIIKLILKNFGPVIRSNLAAPPQGGRDIQRDQRYEKCQMCHAHLSSLREEGARIVRESPTSPAGKVIRERALMMAFAAL